MYVCMYVCMHACMYGWMYNTQQCKAMHIHKSTLQHLMHLLMHNLDDRVPGVELHLISFIGIPYYYVICNTGIVL
jgi:hypothetical protein